MYYKSTRDASIKKSAAEAIACGLSADGGLFVPEYIPCLPDGALDKLCKMGYVERAVYVMSLYLEDYSAAELTAFASAAYGPRGFDTPAAAPAKKLDANTHFLELWHGPTCAFKDMALQMLPHLLTAALKKTGEKRAVCILVATSGDTGKAALEGFCDVPGTRIIVFYPENGVSDIQKLQMTSQKGDNVLVSAVKGNFDDAQTGVKKIFSDKEFAARLSERGFFLSSANSINWGRLLPQIVYYISAYCDMINDGTVVSGAPVNFCVPTGNFGDILAGYYAKKMGLPIKTLICASNRNDVLTDFIRTGEYNRNRPFHTTISPSMDILISSNLERLLFDLSGGSDAEVAEYMTKLAAEGRYNVSKRIFDAVQSEFYGGCCSDEETKAVIRETFEKFGYLIDTHTAVAYKVLASYRAETGDAAPSVVVSTASPYKFCDSVLDALGDKSGAAGIGLIEQLEKVSGVPAPKPLKALKDASVRFNRSVPKDGMRGVVDDFLK